MANEQVWHRDDHGNEADDDRHGEERNNGVVRAMRAQSRMSRWTKVPATTESHPADERGAKMPPPVSPKGWPARLAACLLRVAPSAGSSRRVRGSTPLCAETEAGPPA